MKTTVTKAIFNTFYLLFLKWRLNRFTNRLHDEISAALAANIRKEIDDDIIKDIKKYAKEIEDDRK